MIRITSFISIYLKMIIKKNWQIQPNPEKQKIEALSQALNTDELINEESKFPSSNLLISLVFD